MIDDFDPTPRPEETERIRKRAVQLLDRRAMSAKELMDKLVQKGEDPHRAEDAVYWLAEIGLLCDASYAEQVVRHYGGRGYGKRRIQQELWRRGVPRDLWETALETLPEERDDLDRFVRAKLRGEIPDRREEKRVADALARRGYSWDEISAGMRRYLESIEE